VDEMMALAWGERTITHHTKGGATMKDKPQYFHIEDGEGDAQKYKVYQRKGTGDKVVERVDSRPEFLSRLIMDGNSDCFYEYKHAQGGDTINIPHGEVYDITRMLALLNLASKGSLMGKDRVYAEKVTNLWGTDDE
jgi:hypothetical protein